MEETSNSHGSRRCKSWTEVFPFFMVSIEEIKNKIVQVFQFKVSQINFV